MKEPHTFLMPTAVLLGAALIAFALYRGLSDRGQVSTAPTVADPPVLSATAPIPAVPVRWTREDAAKFAQAELQRHKARIASRCLPDGGSRPLGYRFEYTVGPDGRQKSRGVIEDRDNRAPEVTACVLAELPELTLPRVGRALRFQVRFELP